MSHGFRRIPGREERLHRLEYMKCVELQHWLGNMGVKELDVVKAGLLKAKANIAMDEHYRWRPTARGKRYLEYEQEFDILYVRCGKGAKLLDAVRKVQ